MAPVKPESEMSISQTAEKKPATQEELERAFDLAEYPGSKVVENNKLVSGSLPPDEVRFELVRQSDDPPAKVVKHYEQILEATATGSGGHQEVFGRTKRGNFVRAHFDAEGSGTKYTLSVIGFIK